MDKLCCLHCLKTEHDKAKLEKLQKTSSKIVLTEVDDYFSRLDQLNLPKTDEFLFSVCAHYFSKVSEDPSHSLVNRIKINNFKTSSRKPVISKYHPEKCRTEKRKKSFFQFFMWHYNA